MRSVLYFRKDCIFWKKKFFFGDDIVESQLDFGRGMHPKHFCGCRMIGKRRGWRADFP
jgi:hypothetical protein